MGNVKSQGIGSFVNEINQIRADELLRNLSRQDVNLVEALNELQQIRDFYASAEHILGSLKTKHGEVAEHVQVGFVNADKIIIGQSPTHTFDGVSRTAAEDYLKNGLPVQSKFVQKNLSIDAINEHLNRYPDFLSKGGSYDIPCDFFDKIQEWRKLTPTELRNLPSAEGGDVARYVIKKIQDFEKTNNVKFEDVVNPTQAAYNEVQLGTVDNTVDNKEKEIAKADEAERQKYELKARASLKEGLKVAGIAAAIDGVLSFGTAIISKFNQGKKLSEFTDDDWWDIFKETGKGTARGGITGGSIYALTNVAGMPAPLAAGIVTAAFRLAREAMQLSKGNISTDDFIYNVQQLATDAAVSGVGAAVGQYLIPIPGVGAIIGSFVATKVLGIIKENLSGGSYYDLVNKAKYQNELTSVYRSVSDSLERSRKTFEDMVQTYASQTQQYLHYKQQDMIMKNKLSDLLENIEVRK